MARVIINDTPVKCSRMLQFLKLQRSLMVYIPTLCHMNLESFNVEHRVGSCRICMVDVEMGGRKKMMPACCTPVQDGMVIKTNTAEVIQARRIVLELLLSDHPFDCLNCAKNLNCELQSLAQQFGIESLSIKVKCPSIRWTSPVKLSNGI